MTTERGNASYRAKCPKACANCRRRKERCDGKRPCQRCKYRNVVLDCQPSQSCSSNQTGDASEPNLHLDRDAEIVGGVDNATNSMTQLEQQSSNPTYQTYQDQVLGDTPSASMHEVSRLLRDTRGKYMFIGDSANLSFLQSIRKVVKDAIGPCSFAEDPQRYQMVEAAPDGLPSWLQTKSRLSPPSITLTDATYLIRRYFQATNCILDLFDEADLFKELPQWLERKSAEMDILSPIYYFVLGLGAQTCPEHNDELAETCFSYGRYSTAVSLTEDPSISTVQAYALITMYLLNASRRNAAFMNLGTAVRAAYALGLHRKEIGAFFPPAEFRTRERIWKTIRILDLFMSASLGRPPSTSETRDTRSANYYSASADLCAISETILNKVYCKRMISTEVLKNVSEHLRQWAANLQQGLAVDGIQPTETLDGGKTLNIGLLHVKEPYYWNIILLTRPFLVDAVSSYVTSANLTSLEEDRSCVTSSSAKVLVHACVDSAIRTIELLRVLLDFDDIPTRLPFVVNSIFVSSLVLGLAHFGDVGKIFPVHAYLKVASRLLSIFHHDAIARRDMTIVEYLLQACDTITEKRTKLERDHYTYHVGGMFGRIHDNQTASTVLRSTPHHISDSSLHALGEVSDQTDQERPLTIAQHSAAQFDTTFQAEGQSNGIALGRSELEHVESNGLSDPLTEVSMTLEGFDGSIPLMSPRTLWFDPYNENFPLFSTTDINTT